MNSRVWMMIGAAALVLIVLASWPTPTRKEPERNLPWQIDAAEDGRTKVFGIVLGRTTLDEAEQRLQEVATISLFKSGDAYAVEAYFDEVTLSGLKGKIVLAMAIADSELLPMFERGLRLSGSPSGKKVTLSSDDAQRVRHAPVRAITYLPSLAVDEAALAKRFGQPAERVREASSGTEHWLYPSRGLDIALGGSQPPVLQYVLPREFDRVEQPLRAQIQTAPK